MPALLAMLVLLVASACDVSSGVGREGERHGDVDTDTIDDDGRFPADVPAGFALVDFGAVEVAGGETEDLAFVADGSVTSFFVVGTAGRGTFTIVLSVRDPDGNEVTIPDAPADKGGFVSQYFAGFAGPALSPNRSMGRPRASAELVPNTPNVTMRPGTWTVRV